MSNVKVTFSNNGSSFIKQQMDIVTNLANHHLESAAKETENVIRTNITSGLRRPESSGNLARGFFAEKVSDLHWGIGNISLLNQNQKYWRHINYGSEAIGANWQHAVPGGSFNPGNGTPDHSSFRAGRWYVGRPDGTTGKLHSFVPNQPIPAHNYIEQTISQIPDIVHKVFALTR